MSLKPLHFLGLFLPNRLKADEGDSTTFWVFLHIPLLGIVLFSPCAFYLGNQFVDLIRLGKIVACA